MKARLFIYSLFLLSGATALVYETVWARSLTLVFGATHEAVSVVLGAFMGGLALGGMALGRVVERVRSPLRLYGVLEVLIAISALLVPGAIAVVNRVYVAAALAADGTPWQLQVLRVFLASAVLVVPTFLMGGTLPVLVQLLVARRSEVANRLAVLYAVNTGGAVLGTLSAGFILLPSFGMRATAGLAAAVNLAIGIGALVLSRQWARVAGKAAPHDAGEHQSLARAPSEAAALRLAFYGTAIAGMGALALEVLWMRGITIAVGNSAYSFSVMLAAFLVGIAIGSTIHAAFPLQRLSPALQFGSVMILLGVASAIVSQLLPHLPSWSLSLTRALYTEPNGIKAGGTLLLSFAIMLAPCIFMGLAFPMAGEAGSRLRDRVGSSIGELIALNTSGAIVGALGAGFVLIPTVGMQRGMLLIAALFCSYGVLVSAAHFRARKTVHPWILTLATTAIVLAAFLGALRLPAGTFECWQHSATT